MILVTGGTGFLGSELVKELEKENDVLVLTRKDIPNSIKGDVSDYKTVSKAVRDADVVFHLAALLDQFAPYEEHKRVTVKGTENVMKAAEKTGVKVIYMSSNAVMNKNKTNYSIAKGQAEEIVKSYWGRLTVPIIRASLIYDKGLIGTFRKVSYLPFPKMKQKIHPAYRGSVVKALIGAMKYGKSKIYNIADKRPILLTDFFKEIARPRPVLWLPPQTIWLGVGAAYPIEWLAKLLRVRPLVTPAFIRSVFEQRGLDTREAVKELKYHPVDTLEMVRKLK